MIERYYSPRQIMELLDVGKSAAYDIIHEMPCLEHPLRVSERHLKAYLEDHTVYPVRKEVKKWA